MSKYFNETLKARAGTKTEDSPKAGTVEELFAAPAVATEEPLEPEPQRVEEVRPARIGVADQIERLFKGSDSIESARESYRAVRTRLLRLRAAQNLRSVLITSASQGEGKSFTSLNLAICCAQLQDMKVLLIDGDLRSRGLSRSIGYGNGPGLAEVLCGGIEAKEAIVGTDVPNLSILASGATSQPSAELFAGRKWPEFIKWSSENYKLVLVDSPPVLNLADAELMIAACDSVLMVVQALRTKREALQKAVNQVDAKKLLGAIYNRVETGARHSYKYAYGYQEVAAEKEAPVVAGPAS